MPRRLRLRSVDASGITVSGGGEITVDVLLDGRRVWSFRVPRDTTSAGRGRLHAAWPPALIRYLDGRTRLVLRDSVSAEVLHDEEIALGTSKDRVQVVNLDGIELGVDKSGALVPTFETRPREDIARLVDATTAVLASLEKAGARPFVGYGTLLGAVREGAVIGHDSDADVAYVSDESTPVDVIRESFHLQRQVGRLGLETVRYSGAAFKVDVREADGHSRGLDVFGGFFDHGRLYLMGEVGTDFEREWIYPLSTATLEGVTVPVPARADKVLEAMYGPSWRVPDPVFQFTTSERTRRALTDWFRGVRPGFRFWNHKLAITRRRAPSRPPSLTARRAADEARRRGATVLDLGAGKGADALWLASQGLPVVAYDFVTVALDVVQEDNAGRDLPLEVRMLNLNDARSVLGEATRLAHTPGPRVVMAQHLIDSIGLRALENVARFCSMVLREGGTFYAEFTLDAEQEEFDWHRRRVNVPGLRQMLCHQGATSVEIDPPGGGTGGRRTVRVVAEWSA